MDIIALFTELSTDDQLYLITLATAFMAAACLVLAWCEWERRH